MSNVIKNIEIQILTKTNFYNWINYASVERDEQEGMYRIITDSDNYILTYTVEFDHKEFPVYDFDVTDKQAEIIDQMILDFVEYENEFNLAS